MESQAGTVWSRLSEKGLSLWRDKSIRGECPEARTSLASAHRLARSGVCYELGACTACICSPLQTRVLGK